MIVDYEYKNQNLILSYIGDDGNIKLNYYKWQNPTKFITCDDDDPQKDGTYVTWDGQSVKEIYTRNPNRYSIYDFLDKLPQKEQDKIFQYKEPNIFFVDIENEILDKKPEPHLAESAIQSISIVYNDKVMVMGVNELSEIQIKSINDDINNYFEKFGVKYKFKFLKYRNEHDLVFNFFNKYVPKMAVITGWNFLNYDWVFLVNRARRLGIEPNVASFTKKLVPSFDNNIFWEMPAHRLIVDYMELYAKWDTSIKVKESQSLDFVSENVLGVKKVNYEGNLKILHNTDYKKFIYYNAVDSILVQRIHEKMRYIDVLYGIATLSKIKVVDAYNTLPVTEGILRKKLKEQKNIVLCKRDITETEGIDGGWVKNPHVGMAQWTCCYDFASLYPTTMRQFNISADSYKGFTDRKTIRSRKNQLTKHFEKYKDFEKDEKEFSIFNNHKIEIDKEDIVLLNGAVFKNEMGVVNQVMGEIYGDRKSYKKKMFRAHNDMEEFKKEMEQIEKELMGI
jgi:DNA polymerase elongation subunit (family B)